MKVIIKQTDAYAPFYFLFVDSHEQVVLRSENYRTLDNVRKGIRSVKKQCVLERRITFKTSEQGEYFYTIKSANGKVVGTSAMFETEDERAQSLRTVVTNAPECPVSNLAKLKT